MKKENVKEMIISSTIELIERSDGDVNSITARAIAEKSDVALGLINYHFGNKENLISICVQRIVNNIIQRFSPENVDYGADDGLTDKERLISFAQQTFDFIHNNFSVLKISILSDFKDYRTGSNSAMTQIGFQMAIRSGFSMKKKKLLSFCLTSIMQTAFLSGENSKAITGYDLSEKSERDSFIFDTVTLLMEGLQ